MGDLTDAILGGVAAVFALRATPCLYAFVAERTNVMHAAIADGGGAGQKFLWSVERLRTYVGTHPEAAPVADSPEQEQA